MEFVVKQNPVLLKLEVQIAPDKREAFIGWQTRLNGTIVTEPDFVSIEFLEIKENQWSIIERFSQEEGLKKWHSSPQSQGFLRELKRISATDSFSETIEKESSIRNGITEMFVSQIKEGQEKAFLAWATKIHHNEALFPGFKGVYLQRPSQRNGSWVTLLQFETMQHLDNWLQSDVRQKLLAESSPFVSTIESHRIISPYAGWFASIAKTGEIPSAWKQSMLVLLMLFPIVMLEIMFLNPLLESFNPSVKTFIGNAISVFLLTFPFIPIALFFFSGWLLEKNRKKIVLGTLVILFLYLIEVIIFAKILA